MMSRITTSKGPQVLLKSGKPRAVRAWPWPRLLESGTVDRHADQRDIADIIQVEFQQRLRGIAHQQGAATAEVVALEARRVGMCRPGWQISLAAARIGWARRK